MQPQPHERLGERDLETWDGSDLGSSSREGSKINESTLGLTPPSLTPTSPGDSQESEQSTLGLTPPSLTPTSPGDSQESEQSTLGLTPPSLTPTSPGDSQESEQSTLGLTPPSLTPTSSGDSQESEQSTLGLTPPSLTPTSSGDSQESEESDDSTPQPASEKSDEWNIAPPPMIAKGRDLFGKYRLLEKIGEGGMGEVWLVDNLQLDRKSALKLIKPEIAHNDKGWRRFQREARLMAKLEHPNAVVVYDFKRTHSMGYIEMEFVRGRSLDKYLKEHEGEQLSLEWIAALLDQLCAVLQEAHGHLDEKSGKPKPIIHRDLKPSNLMLMDRKPPGQNLKVLDFGIAKMIEEDGGPEVTLTAAGDLLGTPAFMSPEQIRGGWGKDAEHEVDNRSDLYSVGVLLYQLLTGKTPFRRRDSFALLAAHLSEPPPPIKEMNPKSEIPASVERLVMQCLDKDPTKRPQNAQELSRMFRAAAGLSVEPSQPKRSLWLAVGAACVGIGLLVVLALSFRPSPSPGDGLRPKPPDTLNVGFVKEPIPSPPRLGSPMATSAWSRARSPRAPTSTRGLCARRTAWSSTASGRGFTCPKATSPATEDWDPNSGAWPPAIVRKPENVRFILISGGTYRRGDPDGQATDYYGQPITPHWVRVRSFYIQETEVTNAEVEDYVNRHAEDDAAPFQKWRDFYTKQKQKIKPVEHAERFPAACVSYLAARAFARERGGRLPTEAEWEFAAKSRDSNRAYPWGNGLLCPSRCRQGEYQSIPSTTPASPPLPWCGASPPTGPIKAFMTWPAT